MHMAAPLAFRRPGWRLRTRRVGLVLVVGAVVLFFVAVGVRGWLGTDDAREVMARQIETLVSDGIRGSVTIGGIDRIGADGVIEAHDIVFRDESGEMVLEAHQASLELDLSELTGGHFVANRGHVRGGTVVLSSLPDGELAIDRAFEAPHPGPPGSPIGPDVVRLENLVADGIEVRLAIDGMPGATFENVSTISIVRAPENGSAHLRCDRIDGDAHLATPIPVDFSIDDGTLTLIGDARRRASFTLPAEIGGEPLTIDAVIRMNAREEASVDVHLVPESFGAAFTSAGLVGQALIAETMTPALDVTVDLP